MDSDFAAAAEFEYDSTLSGPNEYYIRSGLVRLKAQNKYKVYCTCMTGICKTEGHQRCIKVNRKYSIYFRKVKRILLAHLSRRLRR